jgi:hypothetical protein
MFKNKRLKTTKKPSMMELKVANPSVHIMDVNMAITKSNVTKKTSVQGRKPIKKKSIGDREEKQRL